MSKKLIYLISIVLVLGLFSSASAELIGHWKFDEGSGEVAFDSSGNGNDGTINGESEWIPGVGGSALAFDGTDDFVGTDKSLLDNKSEFTLTFWVAAGNAGASRIGLVGQNDLIEMGFMSGNAEIWTSASGTTNTPWTFDDFTWHYFTVVGDATSMNIYLDGELLATGSGSANYGTSTFPVNIGGGGVWDASGNWFNGWIDDVRIYDHALSEAEIESAMNSAGGKWPFALSPVPEDGSYHADTWANLAWSPGGFAASHDVFFSDNFDDVDAGAESTFIGNQSDTFLVVGFPGFPYPDGLVPGTTYYWRIDEVNDAEPNSPWMGPVWSFMIPPKTAYLPNPADGAESVGVDDSLSWTAGFGTK
ncbi:MAG: LamG domain-containing protein, partial [Planctomycetota bacterium]